MIPRFSLPSRKRLARPERRSVAGEVIRRFFDLIDRLERTPPREGRTAPEIKARILRLDSDASRPS